MKLPPYPRYKDSGIDWLGKVPEHWGVKRFKYLFTPSDERNGERIVGEMLSVSGYRGIVVKEYEDENQKRAEENLRDYRVVRPGQLVVNTMWLNYAGLGVSRFEGHVSPAYRSYYISKEITSWFAHHLLRSAIYVSGYTKYLQGIRPNSLQIKAEDFHNFPVLLPSAEEQAEIINFLDRETVKIDALIAKQEQLVILLQEKRRTLISHAVTKGLDQNVLLKDSGIEWLGNIPEHWKLMRISSISTKITNGYVGPTRDILVDEGIRYLQSLHIKNNQIRFDNKYFVTEEWNKQHQKSILKENDLLIVQTGDIGQVAAVTKEFEGVNCHALIIVSPRHQEVEGKFLALLMNSNYGFHSLKAIQTGALHPHLNCGDIKDIFVTVPPVAEQKEIILYLDCESAKIDALIEKAQQAIKLLQEHRTALISSAVTGKIDVRQNSNGNLSNH